MSMKTTPRHPIGHDFNSKFADGDPFGIRLGIITRVDEVNMKADLKIVSGGGTERMEVDLTQTMYGPRSFLGGIPELNALAIIGYRRYKKNLADAVILGYLPVGNRSGARFDPFSTTDPADFDAEDGVEMRELFGQTTRYKRLMLRSGDVGGMSSSGAEFVLSKDVALTNRAGDFIELRDSDRTLVTQAIHRVDSDSGVKRIYGPIRRGGIFLPPDIFSAERTLKTEDEGYYGRDELQAAGPGPVGGSAKFANSEGKMLDLFNDFKTYPTVTYSNGRQVYYVPTTPGQSIEDADSSADSFVENRLEISHTSNLTQDVLDEIDGFAADRRPPYIERVLGTTVGNDLTSTAGQRQYGKILKPKLFTDFTTRTAGKFTMAEIDRQPTAPDLDSVTTAGAYLFRIRPPRSIGANEFVAAVSKQGKVFLNIPASQVEDYASGSKRISMEANLEGALKAYIGASNPDRVSVNLTCEGGVHLDIGHDSAGNAITTTFRSGTKTIYEGTPNDDDVATSIQVRGVKQSAITGAEVKNIEGKKETMVNGKYHIRADKMTVNAFQGYTGNYGEMNLLVSGKSQLNYALAVLETIVLGGKIMTVLAGGLITNVLAGAMTTTVAAGATVFNNPAGAFTVTVGTGALSLTTASGAITLSTGAGAMSLAAGAGVVSITAGLALNLTAATAVVVVAPTIFLGGPSAVLGVCRGIPAMPPGTPTLDPITGIPLLGSATVYSN